MSWVRRVVGSFVSWVSRVVGSLCWAGAAHTEPHFHGKISVSQSTDTFSLITTRINCSSRVLGGRSAVEMFQAQREIDNNFACGSQVGAVIASPSTARVRCRTRRPSAKINFHAKICVVKLIYFTSPCSTLNAFFLAY